ncbi:MAG: 6-bladed beta-propeller [Flavobacteriales bacterium]|nr:6-bladed beta-propeller [Flavobacteriales bacterium]
MKLKTTCLIYSAVILICTVCSCGGKKPSAVSTADGFSTIKINEIEQTDINLSDVCDSIEYVKLETNEKCLIGYITKIIPIGDSLLVVDKETARKIFLFDGSGKFIRQISQRGEGPQEYEIITDVAVNNNQICIIDGARLKLLLYNIDGTFIKSIRLDYNVNKIEYSSKDMLAMYFWSNNKSTLAKNAESPTLGVYDLNEEKLIGTHLWHDNRINTTFIMMCLNTLHPDVDGGTYFFKDMCDTIYNVKKDVVSKSIFIDFGDVHRNSQKEYAEMACNTSAENIKEMFNLKRQMPFYMINRAITGGDFFIALFNSKGMSQILLYNKKTGNVKLSHLKKNGGFGIKNDIDKLSSFNMYAADKEHVYGTLSTELLLLPLTKLELPKSLDSLKAITKETDNPIIVKFKIKIF